MSKFKKKVKDQILTCAQNNPSLGAKRDIGKVTCKSI